MLDVTNEQRESLFRYDANADLHAELGQLSESDGLTEERFTFTGAHGHRVPGILVYPSASLTTFPTIVIQHGLNSHKDDPRIGQLRRAWAAKGFACATIDAPLHGDRVDTERLDLMALLTAPRRGLEYVQQTVIDFRRMLDYLDGHAAVVAPGGYGYLGISMSSLTGVQFVAVEPRVQAACFALGGAGLFHILAGRGAPEIRPELERIAQLIDPLHFAGRIAPRPVLQVNGLEDKVIPAMLGHMLQGALAEPKQVLWYAGGHDSIPLDIIAAMEQFFATHLAA